MRNATDWYVGSLDPAIYCCIASNLVTTRVVITGNRMLHIMERHPDSYPMVLAGLQQTIQDPDYILRDDRHVDTGLVIRRLQGESNHMMVVLRICTDMSQGIGANSIISGWVISTQRLERYLRSTPILYSRRDSC